jgi:putative ABC transport system permease protein
MSEEERVVNFNFISPGWFTTMGTTLIAGRDFDGRDRVGGGRVAIVNRKFAEKYYDGENPIGKTIVQPGRPDEPAVSAEIVGLVSDAVYTNLRDPLTPTAYWALGQDPEPSSTMTLTLRTTAPDPVALTQSVTSAIMGVHPSLTVSFRPLEEYVTNTLSQERLIAMLSGFFGALALLLAALGLYGITAYAVARRRIELGIRMALGASPGSVVRNVMSRTGGLVLGGILVGGLVAWWASRFVSALLFGLEPTDPWTIGGAMLVLTVVAALAGWLPARRAARIDPAEVLREG